MLKKAKKEKKEKKPREKKVKEKKPREKKPKKPKKPKEPKPKKEKKVKGKGEEKKGGKKKLLILIPLLAAVAAVVVFVVLPKIRGGSEPSAEDTEQSEQAGQAEQEGEDEAGEEGEEEEKEADPENRDPADDGNDIDEEGTEPLSVSQAVNYVMTLPPSLLGLDGVNMNEYDIYPGGAVVRVDGMACTEMSVYRKSDTAGTNNIVGTYLLSRGESRHMFKLDKVSKQVTEIPLPDAEPADEGSEAPEEGEGGEDE